MKGVAVFDRQTIRSTALQAVLLFLRLGEESYGRPSRRFPMVYSPYAGETIDFEPVRITVAGPRAGAGEYHLILKMCAQGLEVEAYCIVNANAFEIVGVRTDIYVNGQQLTRRTATLRDGKFNPWGVRDDLDVQSIVATIRMPEILPDE